MDTNMKCFPWELAPPSFVPVPHFFEWKTCNIFERSGKHVVLCLPGGETWIAAFHLRVKRDLLNNANEADLCQSSTYWRKNTSDKILCNTKGVIYFICISIREKYTCIYMGKTSRELSDGKWSEQEANIQQYNWGQPNQQSCRAFKRGQQDITLLKNIANKKHKQQKQQT